MKHMKRVAAGILMFCMIASNLGANPCKHQVYAEEASLVLAETQNEMDEVETSEEEMEVAETETILADESASEETIIEEEWEELKETSIESELVSETEKSEETETQAPIQIDVASPILKSAKVVSYDSVKVSWKKTANADEYILYKKRKSSDKWTKVASTDARSYTVTNLKCGKIYEFTVAAVNKEGPKTVKSAYGENVLSAKPLPLSPKISLKSSSKSSATISWKPVEGATSYKVYYQKKDSWKVKESVDASVTEYTWTDLKDSTVQNLSVRAYHEEVAGSLDKTGFEIARKTPVVTMHSIKITSGGKATIHWDPVSEADGYYIYRRDKNHGWKIVGSVSNSKTSWSEKGLSKSEEYSYKVKGYRSLNGKKVKGLIGRSMSPTLTFTGDYVHNVKKTFIGTSAAGRKMYVFTVGSGSNHLNIISGLHAFEDEWDRDSKPLIKTSEEFISSMSKSTSFLENHNMEVNVISMANPDGYYDGYSCNGPGRCTTYRYNSSGNLVKGGVDMNRCFPTGFSPNYESRYYTGPNSLMCKEARILASFLNNWKGSGRNYFVDMHGWYNQIITRYKGSGLLYQGLHKYFPNSTPSSCAGRGYIMAYA